MDEERSVFNMGVANLQRIDKALSMAGDKRLDKDIIQWQLLLDYVYSQSYPFIRGQKSFVRVEDAMNKAKFAIEEDASVENCYQRLHTLEFELTTCMFDAGLYSARPDDPNIAFKG